MQLLGHENPLHEALYSHEARRSAATDSAESCSVHSASADPALWFYVAHHTVAELSFPVINYYITTCLFGLNVTEIKNDISEKKAAEKS